MATAISSDELAMVEPMRRNGGALIGEILLHAGVLKESDVARIILVQRSKGLRFGEAAQQLGIVTERDVRFALARQLDYPYATDHSALSPRIATAFEPFGAYAEAMRTLRSQLLLRWFADSNHKTLVVLGARKEDGHSIVAANLAVAFAQMGEQTLLIDANLRSPQQQDLFGVGTTEGLSAALSGRAPLKSCVSNIDSFANLSLLSAGLTVPNPQELLSNLSFAYMLETLPATFDVTIVDAPPVLECADAQIIAARARGGILVGRRHQTQLADIEQATAALEPSGVKLLGIVVND